MGRAAEGARNRPGVAAGSGRRRARGCRRALQAPRSVLAAAPLAAAHYIAAFWLRRPWAAANCAARAAPRARIQHGLAPGLHTCPGSAASQLTPRGYGVPGYRVLASGTRRMLLSRPGRHLSAAAGRAVPPPGVRRPARSACFARCCMPPCTQHLAAVDWCMGVGAAEGWPAAWRHRRRGRGRGTARGARGHPLTSSSPSPGWRAAAHRRPQRGERQRRAGACSGAASVSGHVQGWPRGQRGCWRSGSAGQGGKHGRLVPPAPSSSSKGLASLCCSPPRSPLSALLRFPPSASPSKARALLAMNQGSMRGERERRAEHRGAAHSSSASRPPAGAASPV